MENITFLYASTLTTGVTFEYFFLMKLQPSATWCAMLLIMCNGNQFLIRSGDCWEWCFNTQNTVFAEWRTNGFWIYVLGQQELSIVFSVHALRFCFLFVFRMNLNMMCWKIWCVKNSRMSNAKSNIFYSPSTCCQLFWLRSPLACIDWHRIATSKHGCHRRCTGSKVSWCRCFVVVVRQPARGCYSLLNWEVEWTELVNIN